MAEVHALQRQLVESQNADGGWSYGTGDSWTEPTALSLLALHASGVQDACCGRGQDWLLKYQHLDGGWPACAAVSESTWVTSLAILALRDSNAKQQSRGLAWLLQNVDPGPTAIQTVAARLRHYPDPNGQGGSPWFPGTAPWVIPTSMSILTFTRLAQQFPEARLLQAASEGQGFLWSRRCLDHGWNHGGSFYRSETAASYPETTGIALLALTGIAAPQLALSLNRAHTLVQNAQSAEGLSWLQLALHKHGQTLPNDLPPLPCRNNRDISLRILALSASTGTNQFTL